MKKLLWALSLGSSLMVAVNAASAAEVSADLQAVLRQAAPLEQVAVIVELNRTANVGDFRQMSRRERRSEIVKLLKSLGNETETNWRDYIEYLGGRNFKNLWLRGALAVTMPASMVQTLSQWSGITRIRLDAQFTQPGLAYVSSALPEWNIAEVGAPDVWRQGTDGTGAVVAIVDTGVDALHADLGGRWRGGANSWYDPNGQHATPVDNNGHGTQVAGIIVGGDATGSTVGVAPGARWIGVKLFNDAGQSQLSTIDLAFQWLIDPDGDPNTDDAPDVVNNSWNLTNTATACDPVLQQNIQLMREAGIAVVFAAGNNANYNSSPANYSIATSVGSIDGNGVVSSFSSRGPSSCDLGVFPSLVAPGEAIKTTALTYSGAFDTNFAYVSGTSFSAPHVAGAMALLRSAVPSLTVDQMEALLTDTATDLGTPGPDNSYGNGLLDVAAAYTLLQTPPVDDADGDGYLVSQDCNDHDRTVYPGAPETPFDGIDQDCNRYDLTLRVVLAEYLAARDQLTVYATTSYGDYTNPQLPDAGAIPQLVVKMGDGSTRTFPMSWSSAKKRWQKAVSRLARWGGPTVVTVTAPEGKVDYTLGGSSPNPADLPAILKAEYVAAKGKLTIIADSPLGSNAYLKYSVTLSNGSVLSGALTWSGTNDDWRKTLTGFGSAVPVSVSVRGAAGTTTATVTVIPRPVAATRGGGTQG